ncbi:hypothetical protein [Novosphingobium sp.]|uniref:hypothetical protein n=1 Tax=Novosphingobium sp. TaxID=1874826 RepID=UPI001ECB6F0F|nr:hypothetical protein [Novosphingobium sp.]MBK9011325.1 hypothetical protein [Novosphingobium sp.]
MRSSLSIRIAILSLPLLLAACGDGADKPDPRSDRDPAISGALSDPLMTDPDLASQNEGGAVLSGGGPASGEVPRPKQGPEEVAAARAAAEALLGGKVAPAPAPSATLPESRLAGAFTPQAMADALALAPSACKQKLSYGFGWAGALPAELAPYPRGHTRVAAGSDAAGCRQRAVSYLTPLPVSEVIDFHFARAAKLGAERRREGADEVVAGSKGGQRFAIHARAAEGGFTQVDVVTAGF